MAAGQDLAGLLILCFGVKVLLSGGYVTVEARPLYNEKITQAYNYAISPANYSNPSESGLGMDESNAQTYAASTGKNFFDGHLFGAPLTNSNNIMIFLLTFVAFDFLTRLILLGLNHREGVEDLGFPISVEAQIADAVDQQHLIALAEEGVEVPMNKKDNVTDELPQYLDYYYLNLAKSDSEKQRTFAYRVYTQCYRLRHYRLYPWAPTVKELYTPIAVSIMMALSVALTLDTYVISKEQRYFWDHFETEHNALVAGNNCNSNDEKFNCDSLSFELGAIYSTQTLMNVLNGVLAKTLYWAPVVAAVAVPATALALFCIYKINIKMTYAFINAVGAYSPALLILSFGVQGFLFSGYMLYTGKSIYDDSYHQAYDYGQRPIDPTDPSQEPGLGYTGEKLLTYAANTAKNMFIGFMNGEPMTNSIYIINVLLRFRMLLVVMRTIRFSIGRWSGVLGEPKNQEEQFTYLVEHHDAIEEARKQRYHLPAILDGFLNNAVVNPDLRNTWGHWLYVQSYEWSPANAWIIYYPVVIGIMLALTSALAINIYANKSEQAFEVYHYNKWLNAEIAGDICIGANQLMNCKSNAYKDGVIYGLQDLMKELDEPLAQFLFWLPAGVFAAIFLANAMADYGIPAMKNCFTENSCVKNNYQPLSNDNTLDSIDHIDNHNDNVNSREENRHTYSHLFSKSAESSIDTIVRSPIVT